MKNRKAFSIILIWAFFAFAISCKQNHDRLQIGVIQYANQSILDSVYSGINHEFSKQKDKYQILYQVAHGDPILNAAISKQLVKKSVSLIIALGTPSAQSVINETKTIPVVFTAITDPVGAKLASTMEQPGSNKTGYTNMQPFDKQIELIQLFKPDAKKVGIIINSGEANCVAGMVYVRKALEDLHIPYMELNATTAAEITACAQSLSNKCDVFFISPSNTIYENLGAMSNVAKKKGIIIVGGDQTAVLKYGSVGTYTYNFVEMGANTADLAMRILDEKLDPGNIPVSRPANTYLYINESAAHDLGLTVSDTLLNNAVEVY